MYEYDKAQAQLGAMKASQVCSIGQAVPDFGGDRTLAAPSVPGITSALSRCNEATSLIAQYADNLFCLFGLSVPDGKAGQSPVTSPKELIDNYTDRVFTAAEKLSAVLNHLNS